MNEMENKKEYEMSYLLTPEISENKIGFEADELKKIIAENGGINIQAEPIIQKKLAYPIKKQNWAHFGVFYFNIENEEGLEKMKKVFALNKKVLRFFILNQSIKSKPAAVVAQDQPEQITPESPAPSFDQKLESILNR
ncbi:30S ribosomal protein S6 [Candidatus Azambacteria bacterium]|nr:30S ribosomal protein S6 [Candidatus Azambacteria bacterium]